MSAWGAEDRGIERPGAVAVTAWLLPALALLVLALRLIPNPLADACAQAVQVPSAIPFLGSAGLAALGWIAAMCGEHRRAGAFSIGAGLLAVAVWLLLTLGQ